MHFHKRPLPCVIEKQGQKYLKILYNDIYIPERKTVRILPIAIIRPYDTPLFKKLQDILNLGV